MSFALLSLLLWPSPHPNALHQVQATCAAMRQAVLAGDADAYLARVSRTDRFFLQEQKCWAAALAKAKPEHFDLTFLAAGTLPLGPEIEGNLSLAWRMPGKRERKLTFPARFVQEQGEWRFAGERWRQVDGKGFIVKYLGDHEPEAKALAEIVPEVADRVFADFGQPRPSRLEVKLYPSQTHIQASIHLGYTDVIGGWNEPGEAIKLVHLNFGRNSKQRKMILAHEMGHVATFSMGAHAKAIPWWAQEGVAEAAAEPFYPKRQASTALVKQFLSAGRLKDWAELAEYTSESMKLAGHVYHQGHHFIAYLTDRFGQEKRNAWLRAMAGGKGLEAATQAAFGLPLDQLDRDWREATKANPNLLLEGGKPPGA